MAVLPCGVLTEIGAVKQLELLIDELIVKKMGRMHFLNKD